MTGPEQKQALMSLKRTSCEDTTHADKLCAGNALPTRATANQAERKCSKVHFNWEVLVHPNTNNQFAPQGAKLRKGAQQRTTANAYHTNPPRPRGNHGSKAARHRPPPTSLPPMGEFRTWP